MIRRAITCIIRALIELEDGHLATGQITDINGKKMILVEQNTIKRLRACKTKMLKAGILATAGYNPPAKGESVQVLWNKRHGWMPPREGLKLVANTETNLIIPFPARSAK